MKTDVLIELNNSFLRGVFLSRNLIQNQLKAFFRNESRFDIYSTVM